MVMAKIDFTRAPPGGNWTLVESKILTADTVYVDFLNLDINTDGAYLLIANVKVAAPNYVTLFAEDDYTPANYRSQRFYTSGVNVAGDRVSQPEIGYQGTADAGTMIVCYITRDLFGNMRALADINTYSPTTVIIWKNAVTSISTFSNITKLRVKGYFLSGSQLHLFRML